MATQWNRQRTIYSGDFWGWDISGVRTNIYPGWDCVYSGWGVPVGPFLWEELEYGEIEEEEP